MSEYSLPTLKSKSSVWNEIAYDVYTENLMITMTLLALKYFFPTCSTFSSFKSLEDCWTWKNSATWAGDSNIVIFILHFSFVHDMLTCAQLQTNEHEFLFHMCFFSFFLFFKRQLLSLNSFTFFFPKWQTRIKTKIYLSIHLILRIFLVENRALERLYTF